MFEPPMSTGGLPSTAPSSSAPRIAAMAGGACLALAAFFLGAWLFDAGAFASPRMKTNTALGLAMIGGAIVARAAAASRGDRRGATLERIAVVLGTLALGLALLTAIGFFVPFGLGVDELFARDPDLTRESGAYPNRMAPNSVLAIGGMAVSLLASRDRRLGALSQGTALAVLAIGGLAILGYAYGVPALYQPTSFIRISPYSSLAGVLGSIGLLALRTDIGLSRLVASTGTVGLLTRRMLLVTLVVPAVLGWVRLEGERMGLFTANVGTSLFVVAMIVTFGAVVIALARSIERIEASRRAAEERLRSAAALTSELARAATLEEVASATLGSGVRALGAKSGGLMVMDRGERALRTIGSRGLGEAFITHYAVVPLEGETPVAIAARTRQPVFVRSRQEMCERHGVPDEHIGDHRSWAALPLIGRSRRLGVLALSFGEPQPFDEPAQAELHRLGSQCAQALERALALEALEGATRRLHAALEAGSIGTYAWDLESDQVEHDAGIARIFGLESAAASDIEVFTARVHPDDRARWRAALSQARAHGDELELRYRVVRADGTVRWVLDKGQALRDDDRGTTCLIGAVVDLTDEHRAHEEAERANRTKDEFLAMLGHELRNPLAPIRTALELMELRGGDVLRKERSVIERQVEHMVRLVDDLLDVSRITRGAVELRPRPLDLAEVFSKAREIAVPLFERKQQRVEIDVPAGLAVIVDAHRMTQAIANLLTNAAKYTPERGHISVRASVARGEVVLEVRDDGVGISPALLPRLFEPFVQGERTIERSEGGLGLGLTIAKTLVEMHGGTLSAESEGLGRGSTFTLRLLRAAELAPTAEVAQEQPRSSAPGGRRVLVVDDNQDAAELLGEVLREAGHHVEIAFDGPSALDVAARMAPEVAFLDIGLPVMDGYELARRLRQLAATSGATLVAVTGYGLESDRAQAAAAGFDHHLVKPIELGAALALARPREAASTEMERPSAMTVPAP